MFCVLFDTNLAKRNRTTEHFSLNCTKSFFGCTKPSNRWNFIPLLFSAPNDVTCILGHTVAACVLVFVAKLVHLPPLVNSPTIGHRANQIDRLINAQIHKCLGEVVERLDGTRLDHKYLALAVANSPADRLAFELVLHQHSITHQRVLAEEVAALLGGLFK